jgi:sugar phosphate permease
MPIAPRRLSYYWVVFAAAFVILVGAAGTRSAPTVLIDPLRDSFGWSRATVGFAVSINVLLFGFIGPFAAALQQRFGLRAVTVCALTLIATGALLTTQMTRSWHLFVLWGLVVGAGSGCMATVFASTVATRWFVARRGVVTGVLVAATASGQLIFLPLFSRLAAHHGWKWVGISVAIGAVAVIPVAAGLLRNSPQDIGLRPLGATDDDAAPQSLGGNPVRAAFDAFGVARRSSAFWILWGSFAVCGISTTGLIQTHFISAAHDHAISGPQAGSYLAFIGVFDIVGTILSGYLTDRYDPRRLLMVYYLFRGLSLFVLDPALATGGSGLFGFIAFYGLDWVATIPPTVALCIRHFGAQRGPLVYGWVFAGHQVGGALAAWGAGYLHGVTGGYQLSFTIAGACCVAAALGVLRIGDSTPELTRLEEPVPLLFPAG